MLTILHVLFYIFAGLAVGSGVVVITARNPVVSVLSLVVTFFCMSVIWMMLHAEFLSLILLLVYVGAVMTLFLFVVMMLNIDLANKRSGFVAYLPLGIIVVLVLTGLLIVALGPEFFGLAKMPPPAPESANYSNTAQLGTLLFTQFVYPFEVAGVLLLAAIIAAITLAHRGPHKRKVQNPSKQISVEPKDRLRLIKMKSRPKAGGA